MNNNNLSKKKFYYLVYYLKNLLINIKWTSLRVFKIKCSIFNNYKIVIATFLIIN